MKKILILGSGLISRPIVAYLLDKNYYVTLASNTKERAEKLIKGYKNGHTIYWSSEQEEELGQMIKEHDIAVSLLPWKYHIMVAKKCIKHKKNMLTTSYVKPEMKALDEECRNAGIIILNELGLDPGIDHMSAMRIIDHIHNKDGKVEEFYSICGALPAPEATDNPLKYKFSWSPKGVIMASNNDGKYLHNGKELYVPSEDIFKNPASVDFMNVGKLEIYPNRDSLPYIDLYGIPESKTMMRGTFRHPGWCSSIDAIKALKLITTDKYDFTGKTYAEMVAMLINESDASNIKAKAAKYLNLKEDSYTVKAIEWLGVFDDKLMNRQVDTPFEIVTDLMMDKMMLGDNERDMVAMQHIFLASYPDGKKEVIKSSLLEFGSPATDTAVARTVALPAAVGVDMIIQGKINNTGIHIPVLPEIYNPILDALESMNIKMIEEFGLPLEENIKL